MAIAVAIEAKELPTHTVPSHLEKSKSWLGSVVRPRPFQIGGDEMPKAR